MLNIRLLRKWSRRADVAITQWGESDVLRFGKGGGAGPRRPEAKFSPYPVPNWVQKKIITQRNRLEREAALKGYGGRP